MGLHCTAIGIPALPEVSCSLGLCLGEPCTPALIRGFGHMQALAVKAATVQLDLNTPTDRPRLAPLKHCLSMSSTPQTASAYNVSGWLLKAQTGMPAFM